MADIDALADQLGLVQVRDHHAGLMARPVKGGFGTLGKRIALRVNTFAVKPPSLVCYHYDVKIGGGGGGDRRPARVNRLIWAELIRAHGQAFGGAALCYDGQAMAYSPRKLEGDLRWQLNLPEEDGSAPRNDSNRFTVQLALIAPIDLGALGTFVSGRGGQHWDQAHIMSAVQALNVVIQHGPMMTFPSRGASFFLPHDNRRGAIIAKGLEMWRGYYTSMRCGPGRLMVNVDLSSHPMIQPGTLIGLIVAFGQGESRNFNESHITRMEPRLAIKLGRFLKGLKIQMTVPGPDGRKQHRKIQELTKKSAKQSEFDCDGNKTNVADYFLKHYGKRLAHPDWPCVRVSKTALWPLEFCNVDDKQKYAKKLDPQQTADSLKLTTVKPQDRMPILRQGIKTILPTNAGSPLNQWGLQISQELMQVEGRILPAPEINYAGAGGKMRAGQGTWDLRGKKFTIPKRIDSMFVFVFGNERFFPLNEAQNSVLGFVKGLRSVGMGVKEDHPRIFYMPHNVAPHQIGNFFKATIKGTGLSGPPGLVVCYLDRKPSVEYAMIKRFGDIETGVATQCLAIPKAKKGNPQYYANLALKVNVKLSGQNSALSPGPQGLGPLAPTPQDKSKTMVFGLDVSHPAPGSYAPSLAAVVGSLDAQCTIYGTKIKILPSRMEIIQSAGDMAAELVKQYVVKNKGRPDRLICFRDGCSEGQYDQVLNLEVNLIRVALQKIDPSYKPKITYIVCAKRHHISLFPEKAQDGDRTGNVPAGTTVDTAITSPFQFDWYTQSHASLLGTSRSAHYTVLCDESSFTADQLQTMVYNLTYTYARCTRSVSYATPAYYADRACTRAALLLEDLDQSDAATSVSGASEDRVRAGLLRDYQNRLQAIHAKHAEALFFM